MQLKLLLLFLGMFPCFIFAQRDSAKIQLDDIQINFLSTYYQQDGNHSAVTGGVGTEQLTNLAPAISVIIPFDTVRTITLDGAVDFYSSASSDNINNPYLDPNHVSGASSKDSRQYYTVGYKKKKKENRSEKGISLGLSSEYDVTSFSAGGSWSKESKDHNKDFSIKAHYYFDDWKLIYPVEFRLGNDNYLPTDKRHTFSFSGTGNFVLNKKMSLGISADVVAQSGMLSTPFHRVYFNDYNEAKIEILPALRIKVPIAIRLNYHITNNLIIKSFYRFYSDSWGISGHTMKLELPIKIKQGLRLYPFVRYHSQIGARYFAKSGEHSITEQYYTSDFDLSGLSSFKYGLGFSIDPLYGIGRFKGPFKKRLTMFKGFDLRVANYSRSDGFTAWMITTGLRFKVQR